MDKPQDCIIITLLAVELVVLVFLRQAFGPIMVFLEGLAVEPLVLVMAVRSQVALVRQL